MVLIICFCVGWLLLKCPDWTSDMSDMILFRILFGKWPFLAMLDLLLVLHDCCWCCNKFPKCKYDCFHLILCLSPIWQMISWGRCCCCWFGMISIMFHEIANWKRDVWMGFYAKSYLRTNIYELFWNLFVFRREYNGDPFFSFTRPTYSSCSRCIPWTKISKNSLIPNGAPF